MSVRLYECPTFVVLPYTKLQMDVALNLNVSAVVWEYGQQMALVKYGLSMFIYVTN